MGLLAASSARVFSLDRKAASRFPQLTAEQEAALAKSVQRGERGAAERLITSNLRHVHAIAQEYRRWGVPMDDLVQQGCLGLLKAAERFEPESIQARDARGGGSLKAYATYWIRAEIRDYVVRGYRIVRLGTTRTERRAVRAFRTRSVGSVEELSEHSGMPLPRCELLWPLLARGDVSLDFTPVDRQSAGDRLRTETPDPEAVAMAAEARGLAHERVERALADLSERERRILWSRLGSDDPETLEQLGKRLGVSRERVRQLESRACEKVRRALDAA
jgi:RNA polymerase sigma-32 factor